MNIILKSTILAAITAVCNAAFINNPPVSGRRPEYTVGTAKQGIDIAVVYDLLCPDSKAANPEFQKFLNMTWNVTNTTVKSELKVSYSFLPMTYRALVWPVHKMVPFILDNCDYGPNQCILYDYIEYCFESQADVVKQFYNTNMNAFIMQWAT